MVPVHSGMVVAGGLGLLLAIIVLEPLLRGVLSERRRWAPRAAAGSALTLLLPVVVRLFDRTRHFHAEG